jgi:hypothetical protein
MDKKEIWLIRQKQIVQKLLTLVNNDWIFVDLMGSWDIAQNILSNRTTIVNDLHSISFNYFESKRIRNNECNTIDLLKNSYNFNKYEENSSDSDYYYLVKYIDNHSQDEDYWIRSRLKMIYCLNDNPMRIIKNYKSKKSIIYVRNPAGSTIDAEIINKLKETNARVIISTERDNRIKQMLNAREAFNFTFKLGCNEINETVYINH